MVDRGVIHNRDRAKQIRDFSGLLFERGITPTDIDLFVEFSGAVFILGEFKVVGASLPYGQRLALERLSDSLDSKKQVLVVIATHDTNPYEDIDAANCVVVEYRYKGEWYPAYYKPTLREVIEGFKRFPPILPTTNDEF